MMNLYLVQHGQAESKEVNPDRPLTDQGRAETELMAGMAAKIELDAAEIRHSGKTRAEQTAMIFGTALSIPDRVTVASGLGPVDDVELVGDALTEANQSVMLVGHLPFMARLTGYLVEGDPHTAPVEFRNSGIVCLAHSQAGWQVKWQLLPGYKSTG